jgi:(p)ppGpp synthase/HD superfamily hydrolase
VHAGQREEADGSPYVEHPLEVGRLLHEAGCEEEVVAAGLLHDTVERSEVSHEEIRAQFGDRIAGIVAALSEPDAIEAFPQRKAALREQVARAGAEAEAVFAADKLSKAMSVRRAIDALGAEEVERRVSNPLRQKLDHYAASLELLRVQKAEPSLVERLARELEEIDRACGRRDGAGPRE